MSSVQSGSRRHSARLQHKDAAATTQDLANEQIHEQPASVKPKGAGASSSKKRKTNLQEEDDGFVFTRAKKKQKQASEIVDARAPTLSGIPEVTKQDVRSTELQRNGVSSTKDLEERSQQPPKKKPRRLSFSTPAKEPARRSKRMSVAAQVEADSPTAKVPQDLRPVKTRKEKVEKPRPPAKKSKELTPPPSEERDGPVRLPPGAKCVKTSKIPKRAPDLLLAPDPVVELQTTASHEEIHSPTKIALPFADTPVISRNKAMRENKASKSERRSSLGLRGRRASSLIDSGASNALPHTEVGFEEFYKHIQSELLEPKRMKQLLTWCATRAMHPKPQGADFEKSSARSAARVIEEELIRELSDRSELSDWFSRVEAPAPEIPLPERPNPKNVSNAEKAAELEIKIARLRSEKEALELLLHPPTIPDLQPVQEGNFDPTAGLLEDSDIRLLKTCDLDTNHRAELSARVNKVISGLEPAVDTFADGLHKLDQYRSGADQFADQVLSICADKLAQREKSGKRRALGEEQEQSPGRNLNSILRGLSKADQR